MIDLTAQSLPDSVAVTLTTANQAEEVRLPRGCGGVTVQYKTGIGQFGYDGTEGATLGTTGFQQAALQGIYWPVYPQYPSRDTGAFNSIYLEPTANGQVATVKLHPLEG